jgi:ribosome-binding ATPase YchF (GTP1/OBG family)
VDENSAVNGNKYVDQIRELVKDEDAEVIILQEQRLILQLESYEERQVFLEDITGQAPVLIRAAYKLLKQQTYFTQVKEVRAWTIDVINCPTSGRSDSYRLRKGFIRAEVIAYEDFVQYGSEAKCKERKVQSRRRSLKM